MSDKTEKRVLPIRCPKCHSVHIYLIESINSGSEWSPGDESGYHFAGEHYRVDGRCLSCKHSWKLRGYIQMDETLKTRLKENYRRIIKEQPNK